VNVSPVVKQIVSFAFVLTWVGIGATLFFRSRVKQNAYLRHFEDKIDFFAGDPIFQPGSFRAYRDISRAMREQQSDADLEQLRRDTWRRFRYYLIWVFGFPLIVVGVAAFLIGTGLVHPQ
jgi:hypothetical protein